ncbi:flagellar motor switch phosphatase FliY [Metabacillus fastidiosus]|uniref:Flagellar motor switch phosphatase FliY n=1 Tax=Metabacillus fastidiosus TaxID=1458 RepID=A0ABU6NWW5_9BACI|nr:flagellar motor switch phosphatase FliY [Metabacillus fastidiosus]MED4401521.1 flagellar motor switch phosphatase FliY [Metabacillus fastidiosus]MED4463155.1 flagellar motor switch phosphatase FliY [Metabacillus fastidiosus]
MVSNDMLSQDEIDALLNGGPKSDEPVNDADNEVKDVENEVKMEDYFSEIEQDAIGEIGNISFGSSATALSTLLNQKVEITTPTVALIQKSELVSDFPDPYVAIEVNYTIGFSGSNLLVIKQSDAAIIADLMMGGDGTNPSDMLGEIQVSAVQEAMNQMMGSAATSMSTVFNKKVDISPPTVELIEFEPGAPPEANIFIQVSFRLKIGTLIDSNIMQLLPVHFARELVDELMNPPQAAAEEAVQEMVQEAVETQPVSEAPAEKRIGKAVQSAPQEQYTVQSEPVQAEQPAYTRPAPVKTQPVVDVKPAEFAAFEPVELAQHEAQNLDMLLDIPLKVTVELGRTKRSVKEILEISSGSIIELDKLAGEPVDILVNNKIIAKGEVVVIDESFGVRVTEIGSQVERLNQLR